MREYTISEWIKQIGKPGFSITSAEYVRHCCGGFAERNGKVCQLPDGWKAEKKGRQWFVFKNEPDELEETKPFGRAGDLDVQNSYRAVKLDPSLITELESWLRLAIIEGKPKKIVIELLPEPILYETSKKKKSWVSKDVDRIFNATGEEILIEQPSRLYIETPPMLTEESVLFRWWRMHFDQKSKSDTIQDLKKALPENQQEIDNLDKRCIWCGRKKKQVNPKIRPRATYCSEEHRQAFNYWSTKRRGEPLAKQVEECLARIAEIRPELAT